MPRSAPLSRCSNHPQNVWEFVATMKRRIFCGRVDVWYTKSGLSPCSRTSSKDRNNLRVWEMKAWVGQCVSSNTVIIGAGWWPVAASMEALLLLMLLEASVACYFPLWAVCEYTLHVSAANLGARDFLRLLHILLAPPPSLSFAVPSLSKPRFSIFHLTAFIVLWTKPYLAAFL